MKSSNPVKQPIDIKATVNPAAADPTISVHERLPRVMPAGVAVRLLTPLLKLGRRDDPWPDLAKPSLDSDLFLSVVPMSAHMGVRRGQGAAGELNKHVGEQPSSSKLVSLYRMPPRRRRGEKRRQG